MHLKSHSISTLGRNFVCIRGSKWAALHYSQTTLNSTHFLMSIYRHLVVWKVSYPSAQKAVSATYNGLRLIFFFLFFRWIKCHLLPHQETKLLCFKELTTWKVQKMTEQHKQMWLKEEETKQQTSWHKKATFWFGDVGCVGGWVAVCVREKETECMCVAHHYETIASMMRLSICKRTPLVAFYFIFFLEKGIHKCDCVQSN